MNEPRALIDVANNKTTESVEAQGREGLAVRRALSNVSVIYNIVNKDYDDVVAFLASEATSYVTGSVIRVDE